MGRTPCCEKVGLNRGPWTREEDMRLIQYIKAHGEGYWRTLPKAAGLLRCGKSCRLRWINYLRPDLKRGNISEEEDRLIIKLHSVLGNRWSLIAGRLPGRTDNEIKNYWNTHLKKKLRNMGLDPQTHLPLEKASQITSLSISSDHTVKPFITKSSFSRKVISSPNYNGIINSSRCTRDQRAYPLLAQKHNPSLVTSPSELNIAPKPPAIINFKAKPLDMDPSQLSAFKRAATAKSLQFDLHVNASCAVPSSPASSLLTNDHIKLEPNPPSSPNSQLNSLWDPSLISASASLSVDYSAANVSDCSKYGSSSTTLSSMPECNTDLLSCMLADLYPRSEQNQTVVAAYNCNPSLSSSSTMTTTTSSSSSSPSPSSITAIGAAQIANYSHHTNGTINLEDAKAIDLDHGKSIISKGMNDAVAEGGAGPAKEIMPECVLSLMEGDFMWDMEMMHSNFQEAAGTPTGSSLLTCSFSYSLWGHDAAQNDTITAPAVPTWLNVGDDQIGLIID